jgi:hypothetical protein
MATAATITGCFVGEDDATLNQIKTDALAALQSVLVGGQSNSIAGRQLARALLAEIRWTLLEVNHALRGGGVPGSALPGGGSGTGGTSNPSFPSFSGPITFAG